MFRQWILENDFDDGLDEESIGVKGTNSGILNAGVGFIIIPKGIDPNLYVEDVMRSGRVSIYGGLGHGDFHQILIDREVLQRISFPTKVGEYGSPIVWVNIPKHNSPVVVACLKYDDDFNPLEENQKRITKTTDDGDLVDIDMNPKKSKLTITVRAVNDNLSPEMVFRLKGKNSDGKYIIEVDGNILMRAENKIVMIGDKTVEIAVSGYDNVNKARIKLDQSEDIDGKDPVDRFLYEDDKGNKFQMNKEKIQIQSSEAKKITFGEDGDKTEPLVKGNTVVDKIGEILDAINQITVPTAFGPSGTPVNSASFIQIKKGLKEILSELTSTE